jgi:phosphoribosylanthranilate isomerase
MPLKTLVKVGSVTNLSDARYCAGMGVDLLGFKVIETHRNYVAPAVYQQIRGWISGPKIVAEFQDITPHTDIEGILQSYVPDYAELTFKDYQLFRNRFNLPLVVTIDHDDITAALESFDDAAYVITDNNFLLQNFKGKILTHIVHKETLDHLLNKTTHLDGLALEGSPEIRPGFKSYDELADILELLDA